VVLSFLENIFLGFTSAQALCVVERAINEDISANFEVALTESVENGLIHLFFMHAYSSALPAAINRCRWLFTSSNMHHLFKWDSDLCHEERSSESVFW